MSEIDDVLGEHILEGRLAQEREMLADTHLALGSETRNWEDSFGDSPRREEDRAQPEPPPAPSAEERVRAVWEQQGSGIDPDELTYWVEESPELFTDVEDPAERLSRAISLVKADEFASQDDWAGAMKAFEGDELGFSQWSSNLPDYDQEALAEFATEANEEFQRERQGKVAKNLADALQNPKNAHLHEGQGAEMLLAASEQVADLEPEQAADFVHGIGRFAKEVESTDRVNQFLEVFDAETGIGREDMYGHVPESAPYKAPDPSVAAPQIENPALRKALFFQEFDRNAGIETDLDGKPILNEIEVAAMNALDAKHAAEFEELSRRRTIGD